MSTEQKKPLTTTKGEVIGTAATGTVNKSTTVSTTTPAPNPPPATNTTNPQPATNPPTVNPNGTTNPPANTPVDPNNIDLEKFISDNAAEVKKGDEKETERKRKTDMLTRAIESKNNIERIIFNNTESEEFVGTKIKYAKDGYGKTVYDYAKDPEVQEHLEFVISEDDPQDGSPVEQQISFFWKKPTF